MGRDDGDEPHDRNVPHASADAAGVPGGHQPEALSRIRPALLRLGSRRRRSRSYRWRCRRSDRRRRERGEPLSRLVVGIFAVAVFLRDGKRSLVVSERALVVALALIGLAAIGICGGVAGIDLDRLVEVGNGAVVLALAPPDQTAIVPSEGILAIDPDRGVIVGKSTVKVALGAPGIATVIERARIFRAELDRLGVV